MAAIGGLKAPLSAGDYDDDPASSDAFQVGPAVEGGVTQLARMAVLLRTNGTEPISEVHVALRADSETGPLLLHRVVPAAELLTGAPCATALGPVGAPVSIAAGLVATRQFAASEVDALLADCAGGRAALLQVEFAIPRSLPPGVYFICASPLIAEAHGLAPRCRALHVLPVTALDADLATDSLALGQLKSGVAAKSEGDFLLGNEATTIMNSGNTPTRVIIRVQPFALDEPTAPPSTVRGLYSLTLRAPGPAGPGTTETQSVRLDGEAATRTFSTVCLRPGEIAALDFGVTPEGALTPGAYAGALQVRPEGGPPCSTAPGSALEAPGVLPVKGPFAKGWSASRWEWSRDKDGDGHGTSLEQVLGPQAPAGYLSLADDCDDARDAVYAGAVELVDGLDNDCDGVVDGPGALPRAASSPGSATPAATPTGTSTGTSTPTVTPSPAPTTSGGASGGSTSPIGSATASPTPTPAATATPTATATAAATPESTSTPTPTPTGTPGPEATSTPTPAPTAIPTATPAPEVTSTPTPTPSPTAAPTATPTSAPTPVALATPASPPA